jgi:hypothetical protein
MTLPVMSCEAERIFSELSVIIKKKKLINYARGKTELKTVLPLKVLTEMCQAVN